LPTGSFGAESGPSAPPLGSAEADIRIGERILVR
jgi:hypothetical protein